MGRIYSFLGLTVGVIVHGLDRQRAPGAPTARDITYGTEQRVRLRLPARQHEVLACSDYVQRELHFAIVDEVDSILIDEARTPLIISGPAEESTDKYYRDRPASSRASSADDRLHGRREGAPVDAHRRRRREGARSGSASTTSTTRRTSRSLHHVDQALHAHTLYKRDVDYVVEGRQGHHRRRVHRPPDAGPPLVRRPAPGDRGQGGRRRSRRRTRRSRPSPSRTTSASTRSSSGMTGTAETEADEFARSTSSTSSSSRPTGR